MVTAPHVPIPVFDQIVVGVVAIVAGAVVALALSLAGRRLPMRFRRAPTLVGALVALCVFTISMQTRATDRLFGGYFSSKTPRERLQDHFADFEEQVVRDPEIRAAMGQFPDASAMLQSMAKRGRKRLDDTTLRKRASLLNVLMARLGDQATVFLLKTLPATKRAQQDLEEAMLDLGAGFVAEWMEVLYAQILAEARQSPAIEVSPEEAQAGWAALRSAIGAESMNRVGAGFDHGSLSETSWAFKTVYAAAPTLPEPHATVVLRVMALAD